jgi:hypothetical protein
MDKKETRKLNKHGRRAIRPKQSFKHMGLHVVLRRGAKTQKKETQKTNKAKAFKLHLKP